MDLLRKRKAGIVFIIVQAVLTFAIIGAALYVDIIPNRYMIILTLVLLALLAYTFISQMRKRGYMVGRSVSGVASALMLVGGFFLIRAYMAILGMAGSTTQVSEMSVIVLQEDPAQNIADALDYTFGIVEVLDREITDKTVNAINDEYNAQIKTREYEDVISLVEALYAKEVETIIFNEGFRASILDDHENFDTETRILTNHKVETIVENVEGETDLTTTPFNIYISGLDSHGSINRKSRSDVNIVATVNPVTKQILLTNTPRDFFVPLSNSGGVRDKLTHAGIYGVGVSKKTLGMLYDTDIDYHVIMNFTGFTNLIDSLGGVRVYSDYAFTADWGPSFKKGYNNVNGRQALAFVRQRKRLPGGDRQRGRNQMHMIRAITDKAVSPTVLTNFNDLMNSLEGSFRTNLSSNQITRFVKFQMDEMPEWNIVSNSVDGVGASEYTFSYRSRRLYVMKPIQETVDHAKDLMNRVLNGEVISQEDARQ